MLPVFGEKEGRGAQPKENCSHSETWRWEYSAFGMFQCIWNCQWILSGSKKSWKRKTMLRIWKTTSGNVQFVFQHDNDSKHTSLLVKNYFQMSKVNILNWPAKSPDLNPIEKLWGLLKTRVQARRPTNLEELEIFAKEEWAATPQKTCLKCVENYNKRLKAVIKQKGYTPLTIN